MAVSKHLPERAPRAHSSGQEPMNVAILPSGEEIALHYLAVLLSNRSVSLWSSGDTVSKYWFIACVSCLYPTRCSSANVRTC
jgi:hypothetical protein